MRFLLVPILLVALSARAEDDKQVCQIVYRGVKEYRAITNGKLWRLYSQNKLTFEQYQEALDASVVPTDDILWRINRYSHLGTAAQCREEGRQAKDRIDAVLTTYQNATHPRN